MANNLHCFNLIMMLKFTQIVKSSGFLFFRCCGASRLPAISASTSVSPRRNHSDDSSQGPGTIPVKFILKNGSEVSTLARPGEISLRLAQRYELPMEGACEASLACVTCHCYVEEDEMFERLPPATEEEEDLLDKAPFLEVNSRLGCQIIITEDISGIRLRLPRATANFYVDGHVPQPH